MSITDILVEAMGVSCVKDQIPNDALPCAYFFTGEHFSTILTFNLRTNKAGNFPNNTLAVIIQTLLGL